MKAFFTWFFNLFKSNKFLMQLAVQAVTAEYLARYPEVKAPLIKAITDVLTGINSFSTSLNNLPKAIKDNIKISGVAPATQALALALIDLIAPKVQDYLSKETLSATEQTAVVVEVLGWVFDIAKV